MNSNYFNESNGGECALKSVDGRNKFFSGHGDLVKPIDEPKVSIFVCATLHFDVLLDPKHMLDIHSSVCVCVC